MDARTARTIPGDSPDPAPPAWLLLTYSVPREPSARRVYVWRRLRQLGAVAVQDATWALPRSPRAAEHFRWLAAEIREMRGTAIVWEARLASGDEAALRKRFVEPVEAGYRKLLAELKRGADRGAAARRYHRLLSRDSFGSPLGRRVREILEEGRKR